MPPDRGRLPAPTLAALSGGRLFVGRSSELTGLADQWNATARGRAPVVLIGGEPGIGKTRLMAEMARTAHDSGAVVLWGRCDEDPITPYQPFVEMLRQLVDPAERDTLSPELRRLLPEFDDADASRPSPLVDADAERYRLFEAVAAVIAVHARDRALLLVVDDLQWAAEPTLLMFRHLLSALSLHPVMLLGSYRDTELDRRHPLTELLGDLRSNDRVTRVALGGIAPDNVFEFLRAVAGADIGSDGEELARRVHAETKGNPFFVGQIARHLAETGDSSGLPSGVREVVVRRVSRLATGAERALTVAAVVGAEFDLATLEAVADAADDPDALLDALDSAVNARLVQELDKPGSYAFVHALVRQTLVDQLAGVRRSRLHRRIADALAAQPSVEPSVLAAHYCAGAVSETATPALRWSHVAAEAAISRWAMEEALDIIDRGLRVAALNSNADRRWIAALLVDKAQVLQMLGDTQGCKAAAVEAADHARAVGDVEHLSRAAILRTGWPIAGVPDPVGRAMLTDALTMLGDDRPSERARVLVGLAFYEAASEGRGIDVLPMFNEAIELAREQGDRANVVRHSIGASMVQVSHPNLDEQQRMLDDITPYLRLIADSSERHMSAHNLERQRVVLWLQRGDLARSKQAAEAARQLDEDHGAPTGFIPMWRAMHALAEGRIDEAETANTDLAAFGHDQNFANSWAAQLFQIRREQGRATELLPALRTMLDSPQGVGGMRSIYGLALIDAEDIDGASDVLDTLLAKGLTNIPRDATYSTVLPNLAELVAATGTVKGAELVYERLLPFTGQLLVAAWGVYCLGAADRYLGMLDAVAGHHDRAAAHFDAALAMEERAGSAGLAVQTRRWRDHPPAD